MDIDWDRELDRAITSGDDRPPSDFVTPGRRALRRRRATVSVASAAAVAVVVGLGSLAGGTAGLVGEPPHGTGVAVDPSQGPTPDRLQNRVEDEPSRGGAPELRLSCGLWQSEPHPARYDGGGALCLAEGAEVLERVPDPMEYGVAGKSRGSTWRSTGASGSSWRPGARTAAPRPRLPPPGRWPSG